MATLLTGTMDEAAAELLQATTQLLKQSLRASAEAIALQQKSLIQLDGKEYIDVKEEHITTAANAMRAALQQRDAATLPEEFYAVMDDLKRSQQPHGDCKSDERYGGVPKACSACMANLRLKEAVAKYKGRPVRLA